MFSNEAKEAADELIDAVEQVTKKASRDWPHGNPMPDEWRRVAEAARDLKDEL